MEVRKVNWPWRVIIPLQLLCAIVSLALIAGRERAKEDRATTTAPISMVDPNTCGPDGPIRFVETNPVTSSGVYTVHCAVDGITLQTGQYYPPNK